MRSCHRREEEGRSDASGIDWSPRHRHREAVGDRRRERIRVSAETNIGTKEDFAQGFKFRLGITQLVLITGPRRAGGGHAHVIY